MARSSLLVYLLCAGIMLLSVATAVAAAPPVVVVEPGSVTRVDIGATEDVIVKPGDTLVRGGKLIEVAGVERDGLSIYVDGEAVRESVDAVETDDWSISDEDDLAAYTVAVAANTDRFEAVGVHVTEDEDFVVLASARRAWLLGFIPVRYTLVTAVDRLGDVIVQAPWWLTFAVDDAERVADAIAYRPVEGEGGTPLARLERRLTNQVSRLDALATAHRGALR